MNWLSPNFEEECRICGTSPCVVVMGHKQPDTQLCGTHFFNDKARKDWESWNEAPETDE